MKNEPIFLDGVFFDKPREGAPDFVKGKMAIQPEKLIAFLKNNIEHLSPKGWINFDLKQSKSGSLYFQVNTWKPLVKPESLERNPNISDEEAETLKRLRDNHNVDLVDDIIASDIPF